MKENIYFLADLHGTHIPIRDLCARVPKLKNAKDKDKENNFLILLGDSGFNYFLNHRDEEFKRKVGKYPFTYFVIRGNHEQRPSILAKESPDKWHREIMWGWEVWVENEYPYIKYAMDYVAMYYIPYELDYVDPGDGTEYYHYLRTLVIPGAYSVDKIFRLHNNWSWFPEEQLSDTERKAGKLLLESIDWQCDLVLSHTCPTIYEPTDLFLPIDQSIVDKTMERYLGEIEYKLNYKVHLWGHYHCFREYPRDIGVPSCENPRQLMIFNDYGVELNDIMTNPYLVNRL